MPFIRTTTNVKINDAQREVLRQRMGEAIELLPGKSEQWLMLAWQDGAAMAFQGQTAPCAMCEVQLYGQPDPAACDRLTGALCALLQETLQVPQERVYVAYHPTGLWGWNGENF